RHFCCAGVAFLLHAGDPAWIDVTRAELGGDEFIDAGQSGSARIAGVRYQHGGGGAPDPAYRSGQATHVHEDVVVIERAIEIGRTAVNDLLDTGKRETERVLHRLAPEAVAETVAHLLDVVVGHAEIAIPGAAGAGDAGGIEVVTARWFVE